jgi:ABC-type branched-subunit amino acid transport system substrate-binding protein
MSMKSVKATSAKVALALLLFTGSSLVYGVNCGTNEHPTTGGGGNSPPPGGRVVIGVSASLSGQGAAYGMDFQNGVKMAVDNLNVRRVKVGSHPIKFELVMMDDGGDPKSGHTNALRFCGERNVAGVVGHTGAAFSKGAGKIYGDCGIPYITETFGQTDRNVQIAASNARVNAWKKEYDAKYPGKFQGHSPYAYDATMALADAMIRAGSVDPQRYQGQLGTTDCRGVTGQIKFDAARQSIKSQ